MIIIFYTFETFLKKKKKNIIIIRRLLHKLEEKNNTGDAELRILLNDTVCIWNMGVVRNRCSIIIGRSFRETFYNKPVAFRTFSNCATICIRRFNSYKPRRRVATVPAHVLRHDIVDECTFVKKKKIRIVVFFV